MVPLLARCLLHLRRGEQAALQARTVSTRTEADRLSFGKPVLWYASRVILRDVPPWAASPYHSEQEKQHLALARRHKQQVGHGFLRASSCLQVGADVTCCWYLQMLGGAASSHAWCLSGWAWWTLKRPLSGGRAATGSRLTKCSAMAPVQCVL